MNRKAPTRAKKTDVEPAKPDRGRRSRELTRSKLIDAALRVMAEKGVEGTAIADITEAADVGFGSFYNHFKSKTEIAKAAFLGHAAEVREITTAISEQEKDSALAVALIQRTLLTKAISDPVWGWFIVQATGGLPELWQIFADQGTADIKRGNVEGRFSVPCEETAMRVVLAALLATMRLLLDGEVGREAMDETIECLLRMLGVPHDEAHKLARRRLPVYARQMLGLDEKVSE